MEDLAGKVAVVTGAASGIGRGIAAALVREGTSVVLADIDAAGAVQAAAELEVPGIRTLGVGLDVTDRDAVEALAERAWAEFGHVELCVNNAGVFPPISRAISIDEADARWVLEVNLMGAWYGCSAFGRRFVEQGTPAHILNTGSENSLGMAHTGAAFYTASKHALLGLSDVLRFELPDFIGVSILCPGMVKTKLSSSVTHRQARFGGPGEPGPGSALGLEAEEVGEKAVEGIKRGDFFIVTHPPVRALVEERTEELLAAFDAQAPRYEGDEAIDTRAIMPPRRARGSARSGGDSPSFQGPGDELRAQVEPREALPPFSGGAGRRHPDDVQSIPAQPLTSE
jgi:NAD(P)-dependent dehydrogenase (short-subunit alcohol dehydrogenase family)